MKKLMLAGSVMAALLILGSQTDASAQGRRPGGVGGGPPVGRPGPPPGIGGPGRGGVDGGLGTASERSGGRSDRGIGTASERSGGRSDDGLGRAREANRNREIGLDSRRPSDEQMEANSDRYQALAGRLGYGSAQEMRDAYDRVSGSVRFGQFVAAHMIGQRLGATNSAITTDAILTRLQSGMNLGSALRDLGLASDEARQAEREARRALREAQRRRS